MVFNPINKAFNCRKIDTIPTFRIIAQYKTGYDIDVRKFFNKAKSIDIYQCEKTGYRFFYPFSLMGDEWFYKVLSENRQSYYHERWEHKIAIGYARPQEKWLEIGSGNSIFLQALSNAGVRAKGLELNSSQVSTAKNTAFEVEGTDFFSLEPGEDRFDVICLFQVLEHMHDISGFFLHVRKFLKPNGKLIISVPNNNPYLYVNAKFDTLNLPPHHMGLWTGPSISKTARHFGFSKIELQYQKLSRGEFDFVLSQVSTGKLSARNLSLHAIKFLRRVLPSGLFRHISRFYRKSLINGRNLVIVLEKNN